MQIEVQPETLDRLVALGRLAEDARMDPEAVRAALADLLREAEATAGRQAMSFAEALATACVAGDGPVN